LKGNALDRPVERKCTFIGVGACHRRDRVTADFEGLQPTAADADALDLAFAGGLAIHEQAQRAFVVQIHAETDVAQHEVRGRAEHIVSGQVTYFETIEGLAQFIVHVLTRPTEPSQASDELRDL
jgi:hypothetical protein